MSVIKSTYQTVSKCMALMAKVHPRFISQHRRTETPGMKLAPEVAI
jgi:hypothetical protein